MIWEYIVLCELWSINICDLNVMYLCFVKYCIKFGIFYIAGHGPARPENRPTGRAWAVRQARWLVEARPGGLRAGPGQPVAHIYSVYTN
jgi:hypothetical protein